MTARVEAGDLWACGDHRLFCGDSTDPADVAALMDGATADLVFTSPPYDRQRDYTRKITDWQALMRGAFALLPAHPKTQVLVNLGLIHRGGEWQPYWDPWIEWMRGEGWRRFGWYVWDQGHGLTVHPVGRFMPSHEFLFHFNRHTVLPRKTHRCKYAGTLASRSSLSGLTKSNGDRLAFGGSPIVAPFKIPDSVIRVTRSKGAQSAHPAAFPPALPAEFIAAYTDAGEAIYEPFLGSGSTMLAAERLGRRCFGMEIAPEYCDIALARWEKETGRTAELLRRAPVALAA